MGQQHKILIDNTIVVYELEYKKVKNLNLRVRRDGSVYVSASPHTPLHTIETFIRKNGPFILQAGQRLKRQAQALRENGENSDYGEGSILHLAGIPCRIRLLQGAKDEALQVDHVLLLTLKDPTDPVRRKRTVEKFLTQFCQQRMERICAQIYPTFARAGVAWPQIKIRSMRSRWGSCRPDRQTVTFARQLAGVPRDCAEYVAVHEFAHLIQPDHSPRFHRLMDTLLPDWRIRKKRLNEHTNFT